MSDVRYCARRILTHVFTISFWNDVVLSFVTSLALWILVLVYLSNAEGFHVFRYIQF